ncbi:MAG: DUF4350 domain-containing protein [bacterium]
MSEPRYGLFWGFFFLLLMPAILVILFFPDLVSRSQFSSPCSTFRSDPKGSKALFLFSQETGYAPERITQPVDQTLNPGLCFSLNPHGFSQKEKLNTLAWIHQGGTYVLATDSEHPLMNVFSLSFVRNRSRDDPNSYPDPLLYPELEPFSRPGGGAYQVPGRLNQLTGGLSLDFGPASMHFRQKRGTGNSTPTKKGRNFLSLFEDRKGPLMVMVRYGQGNLIVLGDPQFFGNQNLTKGDNLIFLSRLLNRYGSENLYFDEYHHGFSHDLSIPGYLWKRSFQFFLCQLLLIVLSWIYLHRKSWGEINTITAPRLRPSSDSIKAMARVYQRVGLVPETIQWLYDNLMPDSSARAGRQGEPEAFRDLELEREKTKLTTCKEEKEGRGRKIQAAEAVRFTQKLVTYRKEVYGRAHRQSHGQS